MAAAAAARRLVMVVLLACPGGHAAPVAPLYNATSLKNMCKICTENSSSLLKYFLDTILMEIYETHN